MKLKTNKNFTKGPRKKIKNQNNEYKIGKNNTINLDWKMKLKTNKTFPKRSRKKNYNKIIKTKLEKIIP